MTDTEKAKAYDEAVAYAKRVLDGLAEDYRCTHMTKDDIINQYSRLFPHEEAFQDDEDSFAYRKLIYGLKSLLQQGKETFAGADITDLIDYLEKKQKPFKEPIDGVLYAAACGIKNKEQVEKSEKPSDGLEDILLEFYDEYDSNVENRPIIPRIYAEKLASHFTQCGSEHLADDRKMTADVEDVAAEKAREYALSLPGGERTTAVGSTYSESGYYHGFVDGSGWQKEINSAWEKLEKDYSPSALDKTEILVSGLVGEKQFSNIAQHFYELGKKDMLKDAVECETVCIKDQLLAVLPIKEFRWTVGDKVNIIILPKEDKQ